MLHLAKLAVGIRDIGHLRRAQAARLQANPPLRHQTRNMPRRAAEVLDGGSIYWVVGGAMLVRQRILGITEGHWDDGSRCASLALDPALIQTEGQPTRAFQGWRYLEPADAPPDVTEAELAPGLMPPGLRNELRALCLI